MLTPTQVSIAGKVRQKKRRINGIYHPEKTRTPTTLYVGTYSRDRRVIARHRLEEAIANYVPQEWPCFYNERLGMTECNSDCVSNSGLNVPCPEQELFDAERKLRRLRMGDLRRFAFDDSCIADVNSLLEDEDIIYNHR
jgi:hypothetical protein